MGVSVGVHHELDAAFDALLVALANLVEDCMDDVVDSIFTDCNNSFNHLLLCFWGVRVDLRLGWPKYRVISLLYYDSVHDLLDEANVGVDLSAFCDGLMRNLGKSLLVHLLLLDSDTLPFCLFLLSNMGLVLVDLLTTALFAPPASLAWTEVVHPAVALAAGHDYCGDTLGCNNLDPPTVSLCLAAHRLNDLHAVVANLMFSIRELPEGDLAAVAWLLCLLGLYTLLLLLLGLLLSALFNSLLENWLGVLPRGHFLSFFILGSGLGAGFTLLVSVLLLIFTDLSASLLRCNGCEIRAINVVGITTGRDADTNVREERVHADTRRLLGLRMGMGSMSMTMMMMGRMMIRTVASGGAISPFFFSAFFANDTSAILLTDKALSSDNNIVCCGMDSSLLLVMSLLLLDMGVSLGLGGLADHLTGHDLRYDLLLLNLLHRGCGVGYSLCVGSLKCLESARVFGFVKGL